MVIELSACFFMIRRGCFCFVLPSTRRSKNEHMQHKRSMSTAALEQRWHHFIPTPRQKQRNNQPWIHTKAQQQRSSNNNREEQTWLCRRTGCSRGKA
jgi:hypothetical protein